MRRLLAWMLLPAALVLLWITYGRFFKESGLRDLANRRKPHSYPERLDLGAVLRDAFGRYDSSTGLALWISQQPQLNELFHGGHDKLLLQTQVILHAPIVLPSRLSYIIMLSTKPPNVDCHACAPAVGGMLFTHRNGRWSREILDVSIIQSGSFGNAPRAEPARIGPERDGVFLRWRDMAQGYYFEGIQLISEYNGRLRVIFERKTGENNDGAALDKRQNYHWSAEIRFLDTETAGFYDIEAEISGTEQTADGRIQDAYKRERWRFVKGKYVLVSSVRQ